MRGIEVDRVEFAFRMAGGEQVDGFPVAATQIAVGESLVQRYRLNALYQQD